MSKILSTDQTPENISKILEVLTETPKKLEALSKGLSKEQLTQPLGKGERSFTEDLTHLINGEARSAEMIYQCLVESRTFVCRCSSRPRLGKVNPLRLVRLFRPFRLFQDSKKNFIKSAIRVERG